MKVLFEHLGESLDEDGLIFPDLDDTGQSLEKEVILTGLGTEDGQRD